MFHRVRVVKWLWEEDVNGKAKTLFNHGGDDSFK